METEKHLLYKEEIRRQIFNVLRDYLPRSSDFLQDETKFKYDLGVDSLDLADICNTIERRFNNSMPALFKNPPESIAELLKTVELELCPTKI